MRRVALLGILLLILSIQSQAGIPSPVERALDKIIVYLGPAGHLGWATPLNSRLAITASHLLQGGPGMWRSGLKHGSFGTILHNNPKKDLGLVAVDGEFEELPGALPRADKLPSPGSDVFWKCHGFWKQPFNADTATPLVVHGKFMGSDGEVLFLQGFVQGGCSGSGVLNEKGELIGVLSGATRWTDNELTTSAVIAHSIIKGRKF